DARYSSTNPEFSGPEFADQVGPEGRRSEAASALSRQEAGRPNQEGSGIGNSRGGAVVGTVRDKGPSIVVLAFLVLAAAALVVIGLKTVRRTLRFTGRDPRELAGACRRDLMAYLADQGMDVPESATLPELGELVERYFAVDAGPFVRAATIARFGPPDQARVELVRARRELRRVRRDMRNRLNVTSRVRGALSLRSLAV